MKPYTILYIAGLSHSGSTLLDLLISSHSQVTGLGEVKVFSKQVRRRRETRQVKGANPLDNKCACGAKPILTCSFWQQVDQELRANHALSLQQLDLMHPDPTLFNLHNAALFHSAQTISNTPFVVDLSKDLNRLQRLMANPEFRVLPIHILREPGGVVYSHVRKGRGWFSHACHYAPVTRHIRQFLSNHNHKEIRYEDLAADPTTILTSLMNWIGLSFEPNQLDWATCEHHHVAGNRLRRLRADEIRVDDEWRTQLNPLQRACISCLTRPSRLR